MARRHHITFRIDVAALDRSVADYLHAVDRVRDARRGIEASTRSAPDLARRYQRAEERTRRFGRRRRRRR